MNLIKFIKCRLIVKHRIPTPPPTEPVKTNIFAGFNLVKFLNTYSEPIHAAWLVMGRLNNGNSRYLRWRADRQDVSWNVMASGWNLIFAGQFIIAWKRVIESSMEPRCHPKDNSTLLPSSSSSPSPSITTVVIFLPFLGSRVNIQSH